jgi:tRNA (uracil-5-)-methyltransferase TRM9
MDLSTVTRLADLNRRFYEQHAENFADSRPRLPPGVRRVLARIPPGARVLEVGCGDGKVGRALRGVDYLGLDQSSALLARAKAYTAAVLRRPSPISSGGSSLAWLQADLLAPHLSARLPAAPFDFILAFAVCHHLPGFATRQRVLTQLAECLAPGGTLAMSNWQFHTSARLLGRQAPWSAIGLTPDDVEPGDALLTWERKGQLGLRYVHALDHAEAERLVALAGLTLVETFASDGANGRLAEYVVAQRALPKHPASPNSPVSW